MNVFNPSVLIHTTLDILGCLPGGSIFDLANAAIYFLEDNDKEGWKSLFFAIPGMDLAGKGMKWGAKVGGKAGKAIEATLKTVDFAGHLGAIGLSANDFGNGISFMIDKYMVGEAEFSSETVWELICLGGHGFQLKSFSGSFMNNVYSGTYDSLIPGMSTANIDLYKVGDWLSQYDKLGNGGFVNPDAEIGFGKNSNKSKTYQTYTKYNPATNETYSGRTSGTGSPIDNVAKRDANHHMNDQGFGPAKLDKTSDNYEAIRGREQMLIEHYGKAKSVDGVSGNAINGIGPNNKNKGIYINAAKGEFGDIE